MNEDKQQWIQAYVEKETTAAGKRVSDAQAAVQQDQEDKMKAENVGLMNGEPEKTFQVMMVSIGDSLSDLASSNNGEDGEDEDDTETEQGQLSEHDEPGWVMGTITKQVQQHLEGFGQYPMKLGKLTLRGWDDAADDFHERDQKYGTSGLWVPAVVQQRRDHDAASPVPTTIAELQNCLDIVPGMSEMPRGTSRPGSSHIGLGVMQRQSNTSISGLETVAERNKSPQLKPKPIEPVSSTTAYNLQLITI